MTNSQSLGVSNSPSILNKKWTLKPYDHSLNVVQNILTNRGINSSTEINAYLTPSYKKGFHNPFLMKDMDRAVERINQAIKDQERIIVFGDYDVDGISGTAVMINALKAMGANVSYRLPHRVNDGYGLNEAFIEEFKEKDIKVLVTVDCGISCADTIALAAEYGIDTIITDHHTIPDNRPDKAYATLHPKQPDCSYPFKGLTGSGVAYKLASALITDHFSGAERDRILYALLDLASLGTVADIGPLLGENRIIVKFGLEALQNTEWKGLKLLMESSGIDLSQKLDVSTIGYKIGPRINAAGRIDHPYRALQMLLHDGDESSGLEIAQKLEDLNYERQQMVFTALDEAFEKVTMQVGKQKILITWDSDWHVGILGLIAGKLVEKYNMPAIAMQEGEDQMVASFRSNEFFNAVDTLNRVSDLLEHYGGHLQAAGFNIKKANLPDFIVRVTARADEVLQNHNFEKELGIDADLTDIEINENFMRILSQMEPFGHGNEKPLFMIRNARLNDLKLVGKEQKHLHFQTHHGNTRYSSIAFKFGEHKDLITQLPNADIAFHLDKNFWNGREYIQFQIIDLKPLPA